MYKHTQKPWQLRSWLITGFVTRLTRRVSVEQELLTLPEHMSSQPVFSMDHVTRSLVCFVDHCVVYSSSIYRFWSPLWYLQHTINTINPTIYNCDDCNFLPVCYFSIFWFQGLNLGIFCQLLPWWRWHSCTVQAC